MKTKHLRAVPAKGGAGGLTNNIIANMDRMMLGAVFASTVLVGFLPMLFFLILGTATFLLLANILIPQHTQFLRNMVTPPQMSLAGWAILAANVFVVFLSFIFGGGDEYYVDDDEYYEDDEEYYE